MAEDEDTRVIVMYLEDIRNARRFMEIAKKITTENKKPIIVLKAGRTAEGAKAPLHILVRWAVLMQTMKASFCSGWRN